MNIRKFGLVGLTCIVAILATTLVVRFAAASFTAPTEPTAAATDSSLIPGVTVSGTVTTPDAQPVPPGTWVWLWHPDPDQDLDQTHGRGMVATSGNFSFAGVEPGDYYVRAVPPDVAPRTYAPSVVQLITVFTQSMSVPLQLTFPSITGTLFEPAGITPTQGIVHVYSGTMEVERRWVTQPDGGYVVGGLMTGTFSLRAEPWPGLPYWWSHWSTVALTPTVEQYVPVILQPAQVTGRVVANDIVPVSVFEARVDGFTSDRKHRVDYTALNGRFALGDLNAGTTITLYVDPPLGKAHCCRSRLC